MLKPRALAPGDRLAVVAPASAFQRDEFDAGIEGLRALGFEPVFDDSVFARARYLAGPPDVRAGAILKAWRDPAIAGLIARFVYAWRRNRRREPAPGTPVVIEGDFEVVRDEGARSHPRRDGSPPPTGRGWGPH